MKRKLGTYYGDDFAIYTNLESWCTPKTNIVYVNYTSIKKRKIIG